VRRYGTSSAPLLLLGDRVAAAPTLAAPPLRPIRIWRGGAACRTQGAFVELPLKLVRQAADDAFGEDRADHVDTRGAADTTVRGRCRLLVAGVADGPLLGILPSHSHWHDTVGNDAGVGLFVVVLAAAGVWMARRLAGAGLWLGAEAIGVRGPLTTTRLAVADVDLFVPGVWGGGTGTPCPVLRRRHGAAVGVWALGREGVIWRYARYANQMEPLCDRRSRPSNTLRDPAAWLRFVTGLLT
jgi:hypothetical protein